jgi:26S proteasome regulatory subunit T4
MYAWDEIDIIKASSGTRNVVGVKVKIDRSKLVVGARVALDQTTLTIMRVLPREVDPMVFNMMSEDPGKVDFSDIGGLGDQLRILRETVELPLTNPELFKRVGIKPPKGTCYAIQAVSCTVLQEQARHSLLEHLLPISRQSF